MKIENIETFVLKTPSDVPYLGALEHGVQTTETGYFQRPHYPTFFSHSVEGFLVKITSDTGLIGWGEAQAPLVPEVLQVLTERLYKPFYLGRDPLDIDCLWNMAYRGIHERGHFTSFALDAMAALDIALWDLAGKFTGLPVHKLLGGLYRTAVPCYISGLPAPTVEGRAQLAAEWVLNRDFDAIKMALGYGVEIDLENLRAVRETVGQGVKLMNDAHWNYNPAEAIRLGRGMEELGCHFLEAPLVPEDLDGLASLAHTLSIDVAMGEERRTRHQFRPVLEKRSADIIQPDIGRTGLTEFRKIANLAEAYNVRVVPHLGPAYGVYVAASIHAAASVPNVALMEFQHSVFEKTNRILKSPIICEAGRFQVPTGPGLGVEINEAALAEHTVGSTS
ncbi:MAG: mandelate racemase/muconate lactonizing enzyme family protein [bacterium]|nr:mandelate racemase/muconate lactonizing enzyme family protein [bacterium]